MKQTKSLLSNVPANIDQALKIVNNLRFALAPFKALDDASDELAAASRSLDRAKLFIRRR